MASMTPTAATLGTEDEHAATFVAEFRRQYPQHAGLLVHVANEYGTGARDGAYFGKLKRRARMGVIKGTADYFLAAPTGITHGLWLELKAPGGTIKPEQADFLERMSCYGYAAACAWGWQAAVYVASRYLRGNVSNAHVYGLGDTTSGLVPLSQLTLSGKVRGRKKKAA